MGQMDNEALVEVFRTTDPALLPLAIATLDQAAIEYAVRSANEGALIVYGPRAGLGDVEGEAVVVVRSADEARARDVLAALETAAETGERLPEIPAGVAAWRPKTAGTRAVPVASNAPRTVQLTDVASGAVLGMITEPQLQFLIDELEEESETDQDYYIDAATIDMLESDGADAELAALLRRALGNRDGLDIAWSRT